MYFIIPDGKSHILDNRESTGEKNNKEYLLIKINIGRHVYTVQVHCTLIEKLMLVKTYHYL